MGRGAGCVSDSFRVGGGVVIALTVPVSVCDVETVVIVSVVTIHGAQLREVTKYLWLVSCLKGWV